MSSIRCVTAKGGGIGRSDTLTNVHASEVAFWPQMEETMDALLDVSGIGEVKACRYGDDFLTAIRDYKHGKL